MVFLLVPGFTTDPVSTADPSQALDTDHPGAAHDQSSLSGDLPDEHAAGPAAAAAAFRFSQDLEKQPWQAQLARLFNVDTRGGQRLPDARLGMLHTKNNSGSFESSFDDGLVRADPIFLKADRDSATLIPPEQIGLSAEEDSMLVAALNDFFAEDGLKFFSRRSTTHTSAWFMSGRSARDLDSYPPSFLANRNASSFLPAGDSAAPWRSLMSEIQMLLHSHPVNQQREQHGLMPVNSVWFWGGADLPQADSDRGEVVLYADDELARSFAQHLRIKCLPLKDVNFLVDDLPSADKIIVLDLSIFQAWLNADAQQLASEHQRIHEAWLEPLSRQIRTGHLESVHLLTEDGLQGLCNMSTQPASTSNWQAVVKRIRALFQR
ncbi:MAG: hypothetical protein AB8B87_17435 [Granulosicoccus sp.]